MSGCATAPPPKSEQIVFYPDPPNAPRIQYLTFYTGAKDIEAPKSGFDVFVTGEKDSAKRLDKPYGVAIHEGKIYVADSNATVMVFDLNKRTYGPIQGAQGLGKLIQPLNISIDKDGNKYVADPIRGQVVVFDRNDFYLKAFGLPGAWKPVDAVAFEDRLYVADSKNAEVVVLDIASGSILKKIGREGEGRLNIPTNVAFDKDGYLYVSDAGMFQVIKFDRDGHFRAAFGKLGANPGFFARPRGVALDRSGRLYAVDAAFDNVQIFNAEAQLLLFFGKAGDGPGDFFLPAKVVIDYDNIQYFQQYADPNFEIEHLILVTNQFGDRALNIYGFGKAKGQKYLTDEELKEQLMERLLKQQKEETKE